MKVSKNQACSISRRTLLTGAAIGATQIVAAPFIITARAEEAIKIGVLLPKSDPRTHDAADALAVAVTHAHHRQSVLLRAAGR